MEMDEQSEGIAQNDLPKANLYDMPYDIIHLIIMYSNIAFPLGIIPFSHVCRQLRSIVLGHPSFWTRISSKMSKDLQLASLARSRNSLIRIEVECMRANWPREGDYRDLAWTLEQAVPHAHRWEFFFAKLCSEGTPRHEYHEHFLHARQLLQSRIRAPQLRALSIQYSSRRGYSDLYKFQDVGNYGQFYAAWRTPALINLVATNYVPYPFIARTVTTLTLCYTDRINEQYLTAVLPDATSLKELHFMLSDYARVEGRFKSGTFNSVTPVCHLPQIETLTITLYYGSGVSEDSVHSVIGEYFQFPNVRTFSIIRDCLPEDKRRLASLTSDDKDRALDLYRGIEGFTQHLHTVRFVQKYTVGRSCDILDRSLDELSPKRLEITGKNWRMDKSDDDPEGFCEDLEELLLDGCCERIAPLVEDLMFREPNSKFTLLRAINCAPGLVEMLRKVVPNKKLEIVQ